MLNSLLYIVLKCNKMNLPFQRNKLYLLPLEQMKRLCEK